MSHYPTEDGFKDEREEPEDGDLIGWYYIDEPCPECGGKLLELNNTWEDILETERVCQDCEYYTIFYE